MRSEELIQSLAADATPVRRLPHPAWRMATWMAISLAFVAGFVWVVGLRADLTEKLNDTTFLIELAAALLTSMMAAAAAFCSSCPGRPVWERFAPFPFMALWLASLGEGCWHQWEIAGPAGLVLQVDLVCFEGILAGSILPAILIFLMVRRGAPIAPMSTFGLATLAATALAAAALRLFHAQDASVMLLVWQLGTVALLASVGFSVGRFFLRWPHPDAGALSDRLSPRC